MVTINLKTMQKIIIVCLLALVLVSPVGASAQATQEEVNAQLLSIINTLMAQVQELMVKLIAVQAQQATDSQKIVEIQTTVTANPAPAQTSFGSVSVPPTPSISFGTPYCNENGNAIIPFTTSGSGWKYGDVVYEKESSKGGTEFQINSTTELWAHNNLGTTTLTTRFGKTKGGAYNGYLIPEYTFTDTIFIGNVCQ